MITLLPISGNGSVLFSAFTHNAFDLLIDNVTPLLLDN